MTTLFVVSVKHRDKVSEAFLGLYLLAPFVLLLPFASAARGNPSELTGKSINLTIDELPIHVDGRLGKAVAINGSVPGPLIRLREGDDVTLRVTNRLKEDSSIHWHGVLVPPEMDGVPGVSFAGIKPGATFVYRFPLKQSGTYWLHSHSGGQEQAGVYAPMIIEPLKPDPFKYDREHVVILSEWSFKSAESMIAKAKKQSGYFNYQRLTLGDFFSDLKKRGLGPTVTDYMQWARMRMDPTDMADVTGAEYTYLMNGLTPAANWTGVFRPGERVRLRFIAAGAMTFFDVRIPGLKMTVVQADGQNVQPVEVDEFRMGPAETYDVIVEAKEDRAYTIFAETLDRSGYARGTLAPRPGMSAPVPARRPRLVRSMKDMGMDMEKKKMSGMEKAAPQEQDMGMPGAKMDMGQGQDMGTPAMENSKDSLGPVVKHGPDDHGIANQVVPEITRSRLNEPGIGLGNDNRRVLVYTDLKSLEPYPDQRPPARELELHLTGHMERFMWSFDGKKASDAKPIDFRYGERLRWTFVNDTMMEHTLHLHGMWMVLENGAGKYLPRKHTVLVKPAERVSVLITPDEMGRWAFHCHLLLHMDTGMFRVVQVSSGTAGAQP